MKIHHTTILALFQLLHAACAKRTQFSGMATWWGKNLASNNMRILENQERDLATVCRDAPYDVIYVSGMVDHFATKGMPSMHLDRWCNASSPYPGYSQLTNGFTLLRCPNVETWISTCQGLGKKVLLSISPNHETLKSEADGVKSAQNVWNLFLGGPGDIRPFGKVVLDGVDIAHRTNEVGYISFVNTLRSLMDADAKSYSLGISAECAFPNSRFGPIYENTILSNASASIDFINLMHLSSQICSFGNQEGFWNTQGSWSKWIHGNANQTQLFATFPIVGWGYEAWINGMTGDFVTPEDIYNKSVVPRLKLIYGTALAGIGMHDDSYEFVNMPCANSTQRYSQIWSSQLSLPMDKAGMNTALKCVSKPGNPIPETKPNPTPSKSTVTFTGKTTQSVMWYQPGQSQPSSLSTGAIAGIGVAISIAVVGLGIVVGLAIMRSKRNKVGNKDEETPKSPDTPDNPKKEKESKKSVTEQQTKPVEKSDTKKELPSIKPVIQKSASITSTTSKPVEKTETASKPTPPTQPKPTALPSIKPVTKPVVKPTQPTTAPKPPTNANMAMMKPVKNSLK